MSPLPFFRSLQRALARVLPGRATRPASAGRRSARRLSLEALEERFLPSATLVKDINPGTQAGSSPSGLVNVNGTLNVLLASGIMVYSLVHALSSAASVLGNRVRVGILTLVNGAIQVPAAMGSLF